ncbi:MAG: anti-sigma factor [Armatimonadota bacterium]
MIDNCPGDDPKLAAWVDDEVVSEQKRAMAAHILLCPACAREVGHMAAHKALLERPETAEEPPARLWTDLTAQLDRVDGIERALSPAAPGRHSLLPALIAAGVILIVGAVFARSAWMKANLDVAPQLLALHSETLRASGLYGPASNVLHAVTNSYAPVVPQVTWQAVGKINGAFAFQRVCLAGRLPVSVITTPAGALPLDGLDRCVFAGRVYHIAALPSGAVVAAESQGLCHCIVARTTLDDLLPLASLIVTRPHLLLQ